jgi:hypothetical protein
MRSPSFLRKHHPTRRQWLGLLGAAAATAAMPRRARAIERLEFDHAYEGLSALLQRHVRVLRAGQASELDYAGMAQQRTHLQAWLARLSAVSAAEFDGWTAAQQMAFLINAYNLFTIELVLTRWPDLRSIREIGGLLRNPWRRAWVPLLGQTLSLDDIEHGRLRERGVYDDPRIHFAVNCASIGCPMLREEAFVAERLDAQLAEQERRFLSDRTRNRYSAQRGRLEVSKIFDWYAEDFRLGHRGITSLPQYFAGHAGLLADAEADRARIRDGQVTIAFLDYDWALNDVPK